MKLSNMRFYKLFMVFLNILNIVVGVFLIAGCFLYIRDKKTKPEPQSNISRGLLGFFITLALFIIVTAVTSCVGVLKLHIRTLYAQMCFYIFLISIQLILSLGAILLSTWVSDRDDLRLEFYKNTTVQENLARQQAWDRLQIEMECCGVDGPQDYSFINREIPPSCCQMASGLREGGAKRQLHIACLSERTYYTRSCEKVVNAARAKVESLSAMIAFMVVFNEFTIVGLSMSIVRAIRRQRRQLQQNLQAHFES